ncbi:predicted protein [Plenodomus lingam JN3]|uniref:Predicted protein n=1 Tax=Leptosphaeria maculans (strain JN3 / isolate v23.1.3 / race Av1-4-5-6-7-8) TaxID=985895 RepID=E5A283_LEPMJ|nr:predicted protein [Plenodomus lingam JN3]CBX97960.1 predicted protein [Plenodomus lingam JN3]
MSHASRLTLLHDFHVLLRFMPLTPSTRQFLFPFLLSSLSPRYTLGYTKYHDFTTTI